MIYDIEKLSRATFVTHDRKRLQIVAALDSIMNRVRCIAMRKKYAKYTK